MGWLSSKRSADGGFEPSRLYHWLKPSVSGNTVNGLGETSVRRPRPVYHYVWVKHPWRRWQNSFYFRISFSLGHLRQFVRALYLRYAPLRRINPQAESGAPAQLTEDLREFLLAQGAGDVAVARMQPEWVMEGMQCTEPFVVTMAIPMDYELMMRMDEYGRDLRAGVHVIQKYNDGTALARLGANWLRERGYHAYGYCGPASGKFTSIPAALAGGLGEIGKHGSIIHRKFGSNFRIAYILTEAVLQEGQPTQFGADEFCTNCQVCIKHCPPNAISNEKQIVRGVEKWYVDFDKCVSYFNETYGCGICLPVCPWSRPGVGDGLVAKLARRAKRKAEKARDAAVDA